MHLKNLVLKNYCGFDHHEFDFTKSSGDPYHLVCFFGSNGIGKTSILEAISLLTWNSAGYKPIQIEQRLAKYVKSKDYTTYQALRNVMVDHKEMFVSGTFDLDGSECVVELTQSGYIRNDMAPVAPGEYDLEESLEVAKTGPWGEDYNKYRHRLMHFVTTDSDLSLNKFQLHSDNSKKFEKLYEIVTGYTTHCVEPSGFTTMESIYCTDFCIVKKDHRIHFKRMSAGERKIAKSFSQTLNLIYDLEHPDSDEDMMEGFPFILLLDNIEMHIYYKRHVQFVDCIKDVFDKQQIFSTTHSGVLIPRFLVGENDQENEMYIDLEPINC